MDSRLAISDSFALRAFKHLPLGIVVFDTADRMVLATDLIPALLPGIGSDLLPELSFARFCQRAFPDATIPLPGRETHHEGNHVTADNRIIAYSIEAMPEGGTIVVLQDITDQSRSTAALRESEARFRDLSQIASDWFWETDESHRFTYASEQFEAAVKLPVSEIIGRHRGESPATLPGQEDRIAENRKMMDSHLEFRDFTLGILGQDGQEHLIAVNGMPYYRADGSFAGYRGTGRDITELHILSETLKAKRAQIEKLMAHAPIPIAFKDSELRFVLANESFYRTRNLTPADVIGKTSIEIFPGPAGIAYHRHDQETILAKGIVIRENVSGGSVLKTYKFPIYDDQGTLHGIGIIEMDITERIQEAQALMAAKTDAERASKAKSIFLAKVSHELRTPLNAIIGFGEVLDAEIFGPLGAERYRGYAQDIVRSGRHLLGIVSDILDISKIESEALRLHEEELDFSELVRKAVEVVRASQETPKAKITVNGVAKGVRILGDETAIQRILFNLIGNALKFTPHTGEVSVSLSKDVSGRIALSIQDSGIGISEERLSKVIQPFVTDENPLRLSYEVAGLGLAIVKALCDAHGAAFTIRSEEGVGTNCAVIFPEDRTR